MAYTIDIDNDRIHNEALAQSLKAARRRLEPEVAKEIRSTVVPRLRAAIQQSAATRLPRRGGLAASSAASTRTTVSGARGEIRIRTRNRYREDQLDRGIVRHPVYGNRNVWVTQPITPGWWTIPVEQYRDDIAEAADDAVARVCRSI